jgi:hypothetical protein
MDVSCVNVAGRISVMYCSKIKKVAKKNQRWSAKLVFESQNKQNNGSKLRKNIANDKTK